MSQIIVIPAFNPTSYILDFVHKLQDNSLHNIIIVNDGSNDDALFRKLEQSGCIVCRHRKNIGKGAAIKTAIKYIKLNFPEADGCITADADGQHTVYDIRKIAEKAILNKN